MSAGKDLRLPCRLFIKPRLRRVADLPAAMPIHADPVFNKGWGSTQVSRFSTKVKVIRLGPEFTLNIYSRFPLGLVASLTRVSVQQLLSKFTKEATHREDPQQSLYRLEPRIRIMLLRLMARKTADRLSY